MKIAFTDFFLTTKVLSDIVLFKSLPERVSVAIRVVKVKVPMKSLRKSNE